MITFLFPIDEKLVLRAPSEIAAVPCEMAGGLIIVEGSIDGRPGSWVVDSGISSTRVSPDQLDTHLSSNVIQVGSVKVQARVNGMARELSDQMASTTKTNRRFLGLLGLDVLKSFKLFLDQRAKVARLIPSAGSSISPIFWFTHDPVRTPTGELKWVTKGRQLHLPDPRSTSPLGYRALECLSYVGSTTVHQMVPIATDSGGTSWCMPLRFGKASQDNLIFDTGAPMPLIPRDKVATSDLPSKLRDLKGVFFDGTAHVKVAEIAGVMLDGTPIGATTTLAFGQANYSLLGLSMFAGTRLFVDFSDGSLIMGPTYGQPFTRSPGLLVHAPRGNVFVEPGTSTVLSEAVEIEAMKDGVSVSPSPPGIVILNATPARR